MPDSLGSTVAARRPPKVILVDLAPLLQRWQATTDQGREKGTLSLPTYLSLSLSHALARSLSLALSLSDSLFPARWQATTDRDIRRAVKRLHVKLDVRKVPSLNPTTLSPNP